MVEALRQPRRVGGNHGSPTGERPVAGGVTGVNKADLWVEPNFTSQTLQKTKM